MSELRDAIAQAIRDERRAENPQLTQFSGTVNSRFVDSLVALFDAERAVLVEEMTSEYLAQKGATWKHGYARALSDAQAIVRDYPLNIMGYGAPMPADRAASVEQFREAVVRRLAEEEQ